MSELDELYPPAQYGGLWVLLAIAIVAVVVLIAWLVFMLTRPKKVADIAPSTPAPPMQTVFEVLRNEYLASIDEIERAYAQEELDPRSANLELSRVVRAYVNEYSGLEAPVLTLDDLAARGVHPSLIDALRRHYYPSIFRGGAVIDPHAGAAAARQVVMTWH